MKREVLISLIGHLFLVGVGGVWTGFGQELTLPPVRVYTVNLMGMPGERNTRSQPAKSEVKAEVSAKKSNVKTERAPSNDQFAPKGGKRVGATKANEDSANKARSQRVSSGQNRGGEVRLDVPFPFPEYLKDILNMIDDAWEKPRIGTRYPRLKASVYFRIQKDGLITDLKFEAVSHMAQFDESVLKAVSDSSPLPPLPVEFTGPYLGVHFDFED